MQERTAAASKPDTQEGQSQDGGVDMLPWRVQGQRVLEALRQDAGFRNRLMAFTIALVVLIGSFAVGVDVRIKIGDTGLSGVALSQNADGTFTTEDGTVVDGEGNVVETGSAATGAGSTPSVTAGDAPAPELGGPAAVPAGGDATGAPAAAPGANPCEGATLGDNDQGVTAKTIKLGFLIPNLNELQAGGFNVGLAGDWDRIIPAWVNELNRTGVGCGRKIEFVKESFDVLSVDDMLAKCKSMTEDHKVFSVLTPGGYDSVGQLCIAKDHKTPLVNTEPEPEGWYRESAPYLWSLLMTKDRMHRNHMRWLIQSGEIKPATKVGVVYHGIPNVAPSVKNTLLPELDKGGIKPVKVVELSSDSQQALGQINQVVLQFRQAGVQYVIMPMNLIFKTQFLQAAEQQGYFPKYTDSDHYFGCFDFTTDTYPAKAFQGTKCVSSLEVAGMRPAEARKYAAEHPYGKYADQVYLQSFPDGYDRGGQDDQERADAQRALFLSMGSLVKLWQQAADRAGPNLTRASWGAAMGQTGKFDKITTPTPLTFGPEKWDGPDLITVVEWHAEAGDGYEDRSFRLKVPAQKALA